MISKEKPLYLLPKGFYHLFFPKAKSLVISPLSIFNGTIFINDKKIRITNWKGSLNHNWGSKHT